MALSIPKQLKSWTRQGIDVTQVMVAAQQAQEAALAAQQALTAVLAAIAAGGGVPGGGGGGGGDVVDATTTIKGKVKLAGDLGGTADLPTVPRLNVLSGKIDTLTAPSWPLAGTPNVAILDTNSRLPLVNAPIQFLAIQGDGSVTVPIRYNYPGMVGMITATEPPRTGEVTGGTAALAPKDLWFSTAP